MIIETQPFAIKSFWGNPDYVCGYCKCPLDTSYGIVVSKKDIHRLQPEAFDKGFVEVRCIKCGTDMILGGLSK